MTTNIALDIELKINDVALFLNESFDKRKLKNAKIEKVGLLSRKIIPVDKNTKLYWAKNCEINCFSDKAIIEPQLDISKGTSMMYGTSCYLFFTMKTLKRITFQIINNSGAAQYHAKKIKEIAVERFGTPEITPLNEISNLEHIVKWADKNIYFLYEFSMDYKNVYFHWMIDGQ